MTRFHGGPADGVTLALRRAPLYLRAVFNGQTSKWDALACRACLQARQARRDQLTDEPGPEELLVAVYRRCGEAGVCMLDWTEKGRRRGGRFTMANYEFVEEQPDDETARSTEKWRAWCVMRQKMDRGLVGS